MTSGELDYLELVIYRIAEKFHINPLSLENVPFSKLERIITIMEMDNYQSQKQKSIDYVIKKNRGR